MDVLSEVLRVIRVSGAIHFNAGFTRPWAIVTSPPDLLASRLMPGAEAITLFHLAMNAGCWITCGKLEPIRIEAGDVLVFPRGDQHVMASDPGMAPVTIASIFPNPSAEHVTWLKHGGGGEETRFVCGYLHSDQRFGPLLDAMPAFVCVRIRDGVVVVDAFSETERYAQPVTLEHETTWWQAAIDQLIAEAMRPGPGNRAMLARLSELLFMQVVRWQLSHMAEGRGGWLAGLNDPHVGRALTLLHAEPARPWTVEELADCAATSRAALGKRFVELVGEAPMQYLAEWRMHLARRLLRESGASLGEIAGRVGYESEAAFNRAFSRLVGTPPGTWRQATGIALPAAPQPVVCEMAEPSEPAREQRRTRKARAASISSAPVSKVGR
ncbi:MAG TPA: AraC family transcriptional regulator [Bradyrhizobium sp.]|nr:AraC family transcriptional regulator [Bradyrhizobium sp.]